MGTSYQLTLRGSTSELLLAFRCSLLRRHIVNDSDPGLGKLHRRNMNDVADEFDGLAFAFDPIETMTGRTAGFRDCQ